MKDRIVEDEGNKAYKFIDKVKEISENKIFKPEPVKHNPADKEKKRMLLYLKNIYSKKGRR